MATKPFTFLIAALSLLTLSVACTCIPTTFREHYKRAKVVVKAKLISATVSPTPTPLPCTTTVPRCLPPIILTQDRKFRFRLKRTFKGCPPNKVFRAKSFTSSGLCGVHLTVGKVYLLFLDKITPDFGGQPDSFSLNICQGNRLFSSVSKAERAFLWRSSKKPENGCIKRH